MRRFFAVLILVLNIGLLSWSLAQGTRNDLFDQRKVDQELEIMKGILGTTWTLQSAISSINRRRVKG